MSRLRILLRVTFVAGLAAGTVSALSWTLLGGFSSIGLRALLLGPVLLTALLAFFLSNSERELARALRAETGHPPGLDHSIRRAFEKISPRARPAVCVYVSPLPRFFVVRSAFRPGIVLLSRGMMAALSEDELRAVLRWSALRCDRPGIVLQSLCAAAAVRLFGLAPARWRAVALEGGLPIAGDAPGHFVSDLDPLSCMQFLLVYPWASLLFRASHFSPSAAAVSLDLLPDSSGIMTLWAEHWISAMRKSSRTAEVWRTSIVPRARPSV